ncbi:unnamed protein product [Linum trigynum]|uniref:Secreted protein n=1 Tax=Linum trigynum TaxID=586398 RepID=A0AAV2DTK6_9ROSI
MFMALIFPINCSALSSTCRSSSPPTFPSPDYADDDKNWWQEQRQPPAERTVGRVNVVFGSSCQELRHGYR